MTGTFKVAAAHASPILMDKQATIAKVCDLVVEAGRLDVRLLAFPETFVPGYPYWLGLYAPIHQMQAMAAYAKESVVLDGPDLDTVKTVCKAHKVNIVLGISERAGGTLYNAQVYIDETGAIIGNHRKLQPTMSERTLWGQGDGSTLKVFDMPVGKVGGLICGEHSMNLARHALILQGEQIHCSAWPTFATMKGREAWFDPHVEALSMVHAYTAGCFVIVAQDPITQGNLDRIEQMLGHQDILKAGGARSAIYGPRENHVVPPHKGPEEKLLVAEIDLDHIAAIKLQHDSAGHYARADVLRLVIDTEAKTPLIEVRGQRN